MTLLRDLPWLRILDGTAEANAEEDAAPWPYIDVPNDPAALTLAADGVRSSHLVLVLPDIAPRALAAGLAPDTVLMASGRPLLWPAENDVTGETALTRGLWVVPVSRLRQHPDAYVDGGPVDPTLLVVPRVAATWACGRSPEAAFRAGFTSMEGADTTALALSAGLGADRPNGVWWGIGACCGLLGNALDAAWAEEQLIGPDELHLRQRWAELARQVRVERGLPVHPLGPEAAAAIRSMRGDLAPAPVWDSFVAQLQDLGPQATRLAAAYGTARAMVWGHPDGA
jgi:hypothetical protein